MKKRNKIIALWGTPRSVSTAFEKTFSQLPDTEVVHEPFRDVYYFSKLRRCNRVVNCFGEDENKLNYDHLTIIKKIELEAELNPIVFFKDFPYQVLPYFDDNVKEFLNSIVNTFIIRHPYEVLASWYKAEEILAREEFDRKNPEEEFGFSALYEMFQIVTENLRKKPIVVEANRFRSNPEKVLTCYCEQIGVTFDSCMLNWKDGRLIQCYPQKAKIHSYWYESLEKSTKINPPRQVDIQVRSEHAEMLEKAVNIYKKLVDSAL